MMTTSPAAAILGLFAQAHLDLIKDPNCIDAHDSCWRANPKPTASPALAATYSIANLLTKWKPGMPQQLAAHRGLPDFTKGALDNSLKAVFRALKLWKQAEVDIVFVGDIPYVGHDFSTRRYTTIYPSVPWSTLTPDQVNNLPLVIRDVSTHPDVDGVDFNSKFSITIEKMITLELFLQTMLSTHSDATLFLDVRNEDAGKLIAFLSHRPYSFNGCVAQVYPYRYNGSNDLVRDVKNHAPAAEWKQNVPLRVVLDRNTLPKIANIDCSSLDVGAYLTGAQNYVRSYFNAGFKVVCVSPLAACVSDCINETTGEIVTPHGAITTPTHKAEYLRDLTLERLITWVRVTYCVAIAGVCRTWDFKHEGKRYNYSIATGIPYAWYKGEFQYLREMFGHPVHTLKGGRYNWLTSNLPDLQTTILAKKANGEEYVYDEVTEHGFYLTKDNA